MRKKIAVLLMERVSGLGYAYDAVEVTIGYFRNYLSPRGLARVATEELASRIEGLKAKHDEKKAGRKAEREEIAQRLADMTLSFSRKATKLGHTYGSVSANDIEKALAEKGIAEAKSLGEPIKEFGEREVKIDLGEGVEGIVRVNVEKPVN